MELFRKMYILESESCSLEQGMTRMKSETNSLTSQLIFLSSLCHHITL